MYKKEMGKLIPAKRPLRAWGARYNLNIKGMFDTKVTTKKGATCRSWVFVVAGHRPEPLLKDKDPGSQPGKREAAGRGGKATLKGTTMPGLKVQTRQPQ